MSGEGVYANPRVELRCPFLLASCFCFIVGSPARSPCICGGLISGFAGYIRGGRGGVKAGVSVAVRSPWLRFPAYGACVGGAGGVVTYRQGVIGAGIGSFCFWVVFLLPGVFWVPGYFLGVPGLMPLAAWRRLGFLSASVICPP